MMSLEIDDAGNLNIRVSWMDGETWEEAECLSSLDSASSVKRDP